MLSRRRISSAVRLAHALVCRSTSIASASLSGASSSPTEVGLSALGSGCVGVSHTSSRSGLLRSEALTDPWDCLLSLTAVVTLVPARSFRYFRSRSSCAASVRGVSASADERRRRGEKRCRRETSLSVLDCRRSRFGADATVGRLDELHPTPDEPLRALVRLSATTG